MTSKAAKTPPPGVSDSDQTDSETFQARIRTLELELEQKNLLLQEGFVAFNQAAEKLGDSHNVLKQQVADLNLELEEKNRALENNLMEREKVKTYLSNIFESLPIGVFVTDMQGAITSVNHAGLELIGSKGDAVAGLNINEVMNASLLEAGKEGAMGRGPDADQDEPLEFRRQDGETALLQVFLTSMKGEGRDLGFILNVQDITLLKQLEEQAERRNRFTAMGEMAANIAHEIRNPLGSIELFASLVKKGLDEADEKRVLMNHISSGIVSMNHIISNVLEYTKPRPVSLKRQNLNALLEGITAFSSYMAEQNGVKVDFLPDGETPWVKGDEDLLKQVFHNIMLNAVQAMTDGGSVTISTRARRLSNAKHLARFAEMTGEAPKSTLNVVEVAFQDTGPGMSKDTQSKIFDPFYTTKSRGTGLGLAIVHNIIESHNATIDVESRPGKGTKFVFMFPVV